MDLLNLVLARLPGAEMSEDRLRSVNRFGPAEIEFFRQYPNAYPRACLFQGELAYLGLNLMDPRHLVCRAAFLEDFESFHFLLQSTKEFDFEIVMRCNVPKIQEFACSHIDLGRVRIDDPSIINWTDTSRSIILKRFDEVGWRKLDSDQSFLLGYLLYPNLRDADNSEIIYGYITAAMQNADPFEENADIDRLMSRIRKDEATKRGYFGCWGIEKLTGTKKVLHHPK
jgi:hypothetical protein